MRLQDVLENYVEILEVARAVNRHPGVIARYIREGRLPAEKIGQKWWIHRDDLEAFKVELGAK